MATDDYKVITESEVTSSSIGDAPVLPDLLGQIAPDQEIDSVTADGAYDTRKCHDAIAARKAHAVIPPRKNAKLWKPDTPGAVFVKQVVRRFHAASLISGAPVSRSGFSQTGPAGCQLRVFPDQRSGFCARAFA